MRWCTSRVKKEGLLSFRSAFKTLTSIPAGIPGGLLIMVVSLVCMISDKADFASARSTANSFSCERHAENPFATAKTTPHNLHVVCPQSTGGVLNKGVIGAFTYDSTRVGEGRICRSPLTRRGEDRNAYPVAPHLSHEKDGGRWIRSANISWQG